MIVRHSLAPLAHLSFTAITLGALAGCPGPSDEPFPEDYETSWTEARTRCTLSHDHELRYIRVFVNDLALEAYTTREERYPPGAALLKAEYDDPDCTSLIDYVLMERLGPGEAPENLEWRWERYDPERNIMTDRRFEPETCINCHVCHCGAPPYGWQLTCPEGAPEPDGGCI